MKILVVGAHGDVGRAVCEALGGRHDLIRAGRTRGDVLIDISDINAVEDMFARLGTLDAVVSTAGDAHFAPLCEQTPATLLHGVQQKVMGQVNLVLAGTPLISDGGSFTLTSGVLDRDPVRNGVGAALANGALGGFVTGAAIELPRGLRLNVVSPGLLQSSVPRYGTWFAGHNPVPAERVGRAYVKSVEGALTGQIIIVD